RMRSEIEKIPILGDIPILGALFRSIDYRRDESELLVVITARLTKPVAPHELPRLPTEQELNDPNDFELFLLGGEGTGQPREEQTRSPPPAPAAKPPAGGKSAQGLIPARAFAGRGPSGQLG